jgi:Zn-dependent metalloprotease
MKSGSIILQLPLLIFWVAFLHVAPLPLQAQEKKASLEQTVFSAAAIRWDPDTHLPSDIKLNASVSLNENDFFKDLRRVFELPDKLQFVPEKEKTDPQGFSYIRYTQEYKGLELARTQYIVHLNEGRVIHAHGPLVREPAVDLIPSIDKKEAYRYACNYLEISTSEASQNSALMTRMSFGQDADMENGKLMLSSGSKEKTPEHFRLVYCFDITTMHPLRRYDVEIDAHSGELVGKYPASYNENIPTTGYSLYNNVVDIVISDTIFKSEWPDNEAYWHPDEWNAYQGSGTSWWVADTANYDPGGYNDDWHVALETDPISLSGSQLQLSFHHRYAMEDPEGASDYDNRYDGWDGINVRISSDGGSTWEVLTGPQPAYTCNSLFSFGHIHKEGPGIPGWAGKKENWGTVLFNLSAYLNRTVIFRFEFASDSHYSTVDDNTLFGWQIDDIVVRNSSQTLYTNSGNSDNIHAYTLLNWVGIKEGNYRLRETTRGKGIATINAENGLGFTNYVDYVQDTYPIIGETNRVGVGIHWASEKTYDYLLETFGRNSYDDEGAAIISYADWNENNDINNASWAGTFAIYGIGNGDVYGSFGAIDVVGHEIFHGVTRHSARLIYQGESGALNESFSDIFGTVVEFYAEGRDKGDWMNAEDVVQGPGGIRSLENPKVLSDPDTYLGEYWYNTINIGGDNGGVHTNSGVQNHWFYLLTEGGSGENDDGVAFQVTGIGLDAAAAIAYRNLTQYLLPDSKYVDAAGYSIQSAIDLFGEDSQQVTSTRSAWEAVGIYMNPHLSTSDTLLLFESHTDDSDSKTIDLINKGIETLYITGLNLSDPDHFTLQTIPATPLQIDPGESQRLEVVFSPEDDTLYNESLTIESSDPEHPVQSIHLSGLGTITGLSEIYQSNTDIGLSVNPNPFSDRLLISYALLLPDQISIEIRDLAGRLLYQTTREASGKETVEIIWSSIPGHPHDASGGIYLLSLRTSTRVFVKKLVKR